MSDERQADAAGLRLAGTADRPEGFRRVAAALAQQRHAQAPLWLEVPARTCAEAAQALGVAVGQIAKSVIFRHCDGRAVLVVAAGDRRVDTAKVAAQLGLKPADIGRADAAFVKATTGFSIGGVAPLAHAQPPVVLLDQTLTRFDAVWAAAGHPNGVFCATPHELAVLSGAPLADVTEAQA